MLHYVDGDIFETTAHGMVNPVNCALAVSAGLAADVQRMWPEHYYSLYQLKRLEPGHIHWTDQLLGGYRFTVIDIATKTEPKEASTLELIEYGLQTLIEVFPSLEMDSIAIPALGCGLGRNNWKEMKPHLERILKPLSDSYDVFLYVPQPTISIWGGLVQGVLK
jgi:O-acetyl-ADP-ribose deacetylase (regulator of RNase III)